MATLTEEGIRIARLDEIIEQFNQGFRQIYGNNINLAPDSPDGQMIGILSQIKMDVEELAEMVYKQLDPDLATGTWLEQRVAYAGLIRRQASYSYLRSVVLTGEPNTPLYAGIVVSDPNKVRWVLTQNCQLNEQGSVRADFRSEELGAFNVPENTVLTIETVTLGLQSATNIELSELGQEEETDTQLRQRFLVSRSKNAQNSADAITAKLQALPDVKRVIVLENNNAQVDKIGVQPHSLNVVIDGGEDTAIAQVIYENKGAGVGLQGQQQVTIYPENIPRTLYFDRAKAVDIVVSMRLVRYEDFTEIDKNKIKQLLIALQFDIGKSVSLSRLYTPINQVGGFWVRELKIGKKGQSLGNENAPIAPREFARILLNDIQIEVE